MMRGHGTGFRFTAASRYFPVVKQTLPISLAVVLAACSTAAVPPAQAQRAAPPLAVAPLAGQRVPLLPLTLLSAEGVADPGLPEGRVERLAWADSIIALVFQERAPEVTWVLPPELRATARRAPATVTNPDQMGHALLRSPGLDLVPDPLRSYLRSLTAMTNARMVLVPAAVRVVADSAGGVRVETALVVADSRNGAIVWRSYPSATAATAAAAFRATLVHVLPDT